MLKVNVIDLGNMRHEEAHNLQYKTLEDVQGGGHDTLILVEHPKVITVGKSGKAENIKLPEEDILSRGYDFRRIERGGDVTFHGPGQIVGYTLFNLRKNHGGSIREFVEKLEQVFINYIGDEFGLAPSRNPANSGVFIGENKIVAVGLAVKKGVTMHGFAFNVNTDLSAYDVIVPCGLSETGVTSLERELGKTLDMERVKVDLIKEIKSVFGFE